MDFPCIKIPPFDDPLELTLPGGVTVEHLNLMEQIQPYLSPLMPIFNVIDAIAAIFKCVSAMPDPVALAECLPELAEKVDKLLMLIPQRSLPQMLVQLLDLLIDTLRQARTQLMHLQTQADQIQHAIDRAKDLNDVNLMTIAQCAETNIAQEAANVGKSLASLGKLIGIINLFMSMVGGPEIPDLSSLSGQPLDTVIEPLDTLVKVLEAARSAIPLP